jgi:quinol monooxygenase YgiN
VRQSTEEGNMHVQIVNFQLSGITEEQYRATCDELAPAFAATPGLVAKVWLADADTNTYGGVYVWRDPGAMEEFQASELFQAVLSHPNLAGISSRDFDVIEAPTAVTSQLAALAA